MTSRMRVRMISAVFQECSAILMNACEGDIPLEGRASARPGHADPPSQGLYGGTRA